MSGGAWEKVAAYVDNGNSNLTSNGSSLINGESYTKDVYAMGSTDTHLDMIQKYYIEVFLNT